MSKDLRDRVARAMADVETCRLNIRRIIEVTDPFARGTAVAEALLAVHRASAALSVAVEQIEEEGAAA